MLFLHVVFLERLMHLQWFIRKVYFINLYMFIKYSCLRWSFRKFYLQNICYFWHCLKRRLYFLLHFSETFCLLNVSILVDMVLTTTCIVIFYPRYIVMNYSIKQPKWLPNTQMKCTLHLRFTAFAARWQCGYFFIIEAIGLKLLWDI